MASARKAWNDAMKATAGTAALPLSLSLQLQNKKRRSERTFINSPNNNKKVTTTTKADRRTKARRVVLDTSSGDINNDNNNNYDNDYYEGYKQAVWLDALEGIDPNKLDGNDNDENNNEGDDDDEFDYNAEVSSSSSSSSDEGDDDNDNIINNNDNNANAKGKNRRGGGKKKKSTKSKSIFKKKKGNDCRKRKIPSSSTLSLLSSTQIPKQYLIRSLGSILLEESIRTNGYVTEFLSCEAKIVQPLTTTSTSTSTSTATCKTNYQNQSSSQHVQQSQSQQKVQVVSFQKLPKRKFCPVTGLLAPYTEVKSKIPYATFTALEQIQERPPPWMVLNNTSTYYESIKSIERI